MIDGLYLSTFFDVGPLKNLLGVRLRHDHGAALWELNADRLTLRRCWEFERLSGLKQHWRALYDAEAARRLLKVLLAEEGESLSDVVAIWGTPGLETSIDYRTGFDPAYAFHGIAHLMTAMLSQADPSWNQPLVAMALDAGPDCLFEPDAYGRRYYPGCVLDERGMRLFPCESPGRLWAYARKKYGLREGTLMALAKATPAENGVDPAAFDQADFFDLGARPSARAVVDAIDARTQVPGPSAAPVSATVAGERLTAAELHISAVMKTVAAVSMRITARNLRRAETEHGADLSRSRLALAGGFALNCPTNSQLLADFPFTGAQIPPCTSDSGIAAGTGLAAFWPQLRSGRVAVEFDHAYYGQHGGDLAAELARVAGLVKDVEEVSADQVAELIAAEGIVAWVNGAAEIGPRALGNRSLLADPRSGAVKDRLNRIKQRQWWRPVAPVVLDEHGPDYFHGYRASPFMLLNFPATDLARRTIPAVLHLDGTARVQSVTTASHPALHELLGAFQARTGVPALGNTSLNDAGEPIANRVAEAVHFAAGHGIASLVVNGTQLVRLGDGRDDYAGPLPRLAEMFEPPAGVDPGEVIAQSNPHGLTLRELTYFYDNPAVFTGVDPRRSGDAALIRDRTADYLADHPGSLDRE